MKILLFIGLAALFASASGVFVPPRLGHRKPSLGLKECANGPTVWCQNITTAANCHAVKHCIQTVWVHKQLPPDTSSVCQTCLDMVKQARDQLLSNETQEEIKEVFEGSCALLKIKEIVKECDKIADEFIPQLIDTLASEMNPQVVCSVAGLCNNEHVHQLLKENGEDIKEISEVKAISVAPKVGDACSNCKTVMNVVVKNFDSMTKDDLLQSFLNFCGNLGTFSDACSNIVVTHFADIYSYLKDNLNADDVCLLSGSCSAQFHTHANVEITPMSKIGYVPVGGDDLPCELCEQLVTHLKDILIANTTEDEFKMIIEGLCKQTGQFADECKNLAEQYYVEVYQYLVNHLNSTVVCDEIGICKDGKVQIRPVIAPLLPIETAIKITPSTVKPQSTVRLAKDGVNVKVMAPEPLDEIDPNQLLPIELLVPAHNTLYNQQVCVFCEYFLHFVQEEITDPRTEDEIKKIIDKACSDLPSSINSTCISFVETYEPALIALLTQEIDPSQICPLIRACPSEDMKDVEVFMEKSIGDSKCPLCLYAVTEIEDEVKNKESKANIKTALEKACGRFPDKIKAECDDFVDTYTDEVVEAIVAELKPQEVCVYLKMCTDNKKPSVMIESALSENVGIVENKPKPIDEFTPIVNPIIDFAVGGDIETNFIPDNTVNGQMVFKTTVKSGPQCVICEFVMKEIEDELKNQDTDADIKKIVHNVCNALPSSVKNECNSFVDEYADAVIALLEAALEPADICKKIGLCTKTATVEPIQAAKTEILECAICELTVAAMEKVLSNPKIDHDITHVLEKTCRGVPNRYRKECTSIIEKYGAEIFELVASHTLKQVICKKLLSCTEISDPKHDTLLGTNVCTYGPSYWCESEDNADFCAARKHCETKVWLDQKPAKAQVKFGTNHCTFGPSYWCESEDNANECGGGARRHCELKVWNTQKPMENDRLVGDNPCTFGPTYWCQSEATAQECGEGAKEHCETKVWGTKIIKRQVQKVGTNECTYGPSYWCESRANAEKCGQGAVNHCESKVWSQKVKRQIQPLGSDVCTYGPSYWCESRENAEKCGAVNHCESKVWGQRNKRQVQKVGTNECTYGPSYWCENMANAEKCGQGAVKHCETKVWGQRTKRQVQKVGTNECTYGPSYWCESRANAEKCGQGAKTHCETKVWNQQK